MSKPYQLIPRPTKDNKWRLNIPPAISPSGKRERHFFKHHHEALAEANKIRMVLRDYGRSIKMLPANRLIEAIEAWDLLDELAAGVSVSGSLRRIVLAEVQKQKARQQSIILSALFDDYIAKLQQTNRSAKYIKNYRWLKGYMDFWLETKVSDITPGNIKFSLQKLPSGNFNFNLRLLRAVLNHAVKNSFLASNPALSVDFVHRPKVEVKCLHYTVVEGMVRHAQEQDIELIPPWTIGFFCGLRESELWKLHYADIRISEKYVIVPAAISKVKRKRIIPLSDNAIEWLQWYFQEATRVASPDERLMSKWTPKRLKAHRQANYEAAAGEGMKWQANCKRRAFASHHVAAYESYDKLALVMGHSTTEMTFEHYVGAVSHEEGLAYFDIRPD
jgi:site-specific recombinase XerC